MEAIKLIKRRTSCAQLCGPEPSREELETLYQAAFRAADHRQLKPARFLQVSGDGLTALGELFVKAKRSVKPDLAEKEEEKIRNKPHRAPMVIVVIATIRDDPKVPEVEQILSVGASVQNMLNAAYAMGLGAIWRTGDPAYDPKVAGGLGLADNERIVGFLYIGTPRGAFRDAPAYDYQPHVRDWP